MLRYNRNSFLPSLNQALGIYIFLIVSKIERERDTEGDRKRDRQTDRQTERDIYDVEIQT